MSGRSLTGPASEAWAGGEVTAVAHCILAPNPSPWTLDGTNTWLIGAPGGACLVVDPGPLENGHLEAIEEQLQRRNQRVAAVVLTHGHIDHSAGAEEFGRRHRADVRAWDERLTFSPAHRRDPAVLSEGEVLEVEGEEVRVLATPGHSSDSVCLVVDSSIVTGDTVLGRGTTLVAHPDGRLTEYLSSLRLLADVCADEGVERLLPGHGPVLEQPGRVLDYYLEHRMERLEQVRRAAIMGANSAREIVEIVYADVPREVWPAAESTVLAQLEYLREHPN